MRTANRLLNSSFPRAPALPLICQKSALAPGRDDVFVINVRPPPPRGGERHPPGVAGTALLINLESFPASFDINYISHSAEAEPRRRGKEFTRQMNVAVVQGTVFFSPPLSFSPPCGYQIRYVSRLMDLISLSKCGDISCQALAEWLVPAARG